MSGLRQLAPALIANRSLQHDSLPEIHHSSPTR
jgi:hypothetical protein